MTQKIEKEFIPEQQLDQVVKKMNAPKMNPILKAIIDIVIIGGVMVLLLAWYWKHIEDVKAINQLVTDGQQKHNLDDVESLRYAADKYLKALEIDDSHPAALASVTEVFTLLWGNYGLEEYQTKAKKYLDQVLAEDIKRSERYAAESYYYLYSGQLDKAYKTIVTILKKTKTHGRLTTVLGYILKAQKKFHPALENFRTAHDLDWDYTKAAYALGNSYLYRDEITNAKSFIKKALSLNSEHEFSQIDFALICFILNEEIEPQARVLDRLLQNDLAPKLKTRATFARAMGYYKQKEFEKALQMVDLVIGADSSNSDYNNLRGNVLLALDKPVESLMNLKAARDDMPSITRFQKDYIKALMANEKFDEGIASFKDFGNTIDPDGSYYIFGVNLYLEMNKKLIADYAKTNRRDKAKKKEIAQEQENVLANAFELAQKAVEVEDWNADIHYHLGLVNIAMMTNYKKDRKKGKEAQAASEAAMNAFELAITKRMQFPEVYHQVGKLYGKDKRFYQEAFFELDKSAQLYKRLGYPKEKLVEVYKDIAQLHKFNRRKKAFRRYMKMIETL